MTDQRAADEVWAGDADHPSLSWQNRHTRRHGQHRATRPRPSSTALAVPPSPYVDAALRAEVEAVANAVRGTRNDTLKAAAFNLGQLVAGGHLDEQVVVEQLETAAATAGLGEAERRATIHSGMAAGMKQPRDVPEPRGSMAQVGEVAAAELTGGANGTELLHARLVGTELRTLRARAEARRIFETEQRGEREPFDIGTAAEVLARPATPRDRVEGLMPWEGSTLLAAQRKAGKTTTVLNLARSLLTGEDFLGSLGVRAVDGDVAILNYELPAAQLARWVSEAGVPLQRLHLVNLRGKSNPLADAEDRGRLAAMLRQRGIESLVCDPFSNAYTGVSQNDAGEVSGFLLSLARFARSEVGALDLVLTAHAGWNGERTRGSTALEDWPDSIITLTKDESEQGQGERYIRALGRDVDLDEDRLLFDSDTRRLSLAGAGSRASARSGRRHEDLDRAVLSVIIASPGINGSGLGPALREAGVAFQKGDERKAAGRLAAAGAVVVQAGPRGAHCYHPSVAS